MESIKKIIGVRCILIFVGVLWTTGVYAQPFLSELTIQAATSEGEIVVIVGGTAIAERYDLGANPYAVDDQLIVVSAPIPSGEDGEWVWRRQGVLGIDFNTDSNPIEFSWYDFQGGEDLSPYLISLKINWGTTLIWRPAPVDAVMSFIDWGQMDTLKMKAPSADITVFNVPSSDETHPSTTGLPNQIVSHHRMWHFPYVPTGSLEVGEEGSQYKVTFQDADFDINNPWNWSIGSKWKVSAGGCPNAFYDSSASDPTHESYYPLARWVTFSGLIEILVPGGNSNAEFQYPLSGIPIKLHSNFSHIWGASFFAHSQPLPAILSDGSPTPGYSSGWGGNDALAIEVTGIFYDTRLELRGHGVHHPALDVWLKNPIFSDPYSQGTAYPGSGLAKRGTDGICSSLSNPGFYPGVRGRARGGITLRHGGASFGGFAHKNMHGELESQPFHIVYDNIGYTAAESPIGEVLTWNTLLPSSQSSKIDGFLEADTFSLSDDYLPPVRMKIDIIGNHKLSKIHLPLAIEWGKDDGEGVGIFREVYAELNNAGLHFIPAPPLIPPTYFPITPAKRIHVKTTHQPIIIEANPWMNFYSNMSVEDGSVFPFSLSLFGMGDELIPVNISQSDMGAALMVGDITIQNNLNVKHNVAGDAPPKIRLGNSNWSPPKYVWFDGDVVFEDIAANGEFLYSPAWDSEWTLRIDNLLQSGVRIKLGQAQNYSGRHTGTGLWYQGQVAQVIGSYGADYPYYAAVQDVPENTPVSDTSYWLELNNPFAPVHFIYNGYVYDLPREGAIIGAQGELLHGDNSGSPLIAVAPAGGPNEGYGDLESLGEDNCPGVPNPYQSDTDGDGIGNACDTETIYILANDAANNDGLVNEDLSNPGTGIYPPQTTLLIEFGDRSSGAQIKGFASFLLDSFPVNAVLDDAVLRLTEAIRKVDSVTVSSATPVDFLGSRQLDIKTGFFPGNYVIPSIGNNDFQEDADIVQAGVFNDSANGVDISINAQGLDAINDALVIDTPRVQFRLYFDVSTDSDGKEDLLGYYAVEDEDALKPVLALDYRYNDDIDSDGDNIIDGIEQYLGTNIYLADSDGDGLTDYQELGFDRNYTELSAITDTDPMNADTDNDGIPDGIDPMPLTYNGFQVPIPHWAYAVAFILLIGLVNFSYSRRRTTNVG